ncbi:alanine racemase [Granulicella sp. S190]|uniref:alanine racemase n=1 Tax=Granulicella sp. S190 TaxID=1747226 RepID=UPI00131BA25D|nr:alanine racemase [Granulicella sp. S190]
MKSWVEVSEERLTGNYRLLQSAAGGGVAVLAVVKANAYGHGAAICAPVLARAGAEWLGVTDVTEGVAVREALAAAGIVHERQPRILVMSGLLREDCEDMIRCGLTPVVWQREQMEWLADAAARYGDEAMPVHLEVDTGMARQGVTPGPELDALLAWAKDQAGVRIEGVMTHFASSEVAASVQTAMQRKRFEQAMTAIAGAGLHPEWVHAGNSSTVDNPSNEGNVAWLRALAEGVGAKPMVRTGIALYGYCLPIEGNGRNAVRQTLQPVMTWKTRVIGLREIEAGDTVGYNGIFTADRKMRLALLSVGYADGLRRELSASNARQGGWAMVKGQRAAIVGRVSMNLTIVDVTGVGEVALGDEAVVLGDGVTADDHARLAGTIAYEILCGVQAGHRCGVRAG